MGFSEWLNPSSSWAQLWQQQVRKTLGSANCRDVVNILWAIATSTTSSSSSSRRQQPLVLQQQERLLCGQLQQELLSSLHRTLPDSTPQDVSNALWACATLQLQLSPELGQYLLSRAQSHFSDFKPQEAAHGSRQDELEAAGARGLGFGEA
ncbi:hypothetical protein OEZ85_011169 [Tetradesmus obliquus]|uniref:Uncharacterized protein n=1 Tax=Tetradesmus obliquus TaxID=3088 RepID=A0ABY8TPW7_TETOB|nr:hypothetical protein OEZ85_011169 [Tetradesmus obliquus]